MEKNARNDIFHLTSTRGYTYAVHNSSFVLCLVADSAVFSREGCGNNILANIAKGRCIFFAFTTPPQCLRITKY